MDQTQSIRRCRDGSIDFDFYRTRATALRGQAIRDSVVLRSACIGLSVIVVVFPLILAVAAASIRAPHGHFAAVQTKMVPLTTKEQMQWLD
jgi:hypothetical protein